MILNFVIATTIILYHKIMSTILGVRLDGKGGSGAGGGGGLDIIFFLFFFSFSFIFTKKIKERGFEFQIKIVQTFLMPVHLKR